MMLFAQALSCQSSDGHTRRVHIQAAAVFCRSEEEAIGSGIKHAKETWPEEEGYWAYACDVFHISDEKLSSFMEEE